MPESGSIPGEEASPCPTAVEKAVDKAVDGREWKHPFPGPLSQSARFVVNTGLWVLIADDSSRPSQLLCSGQGGLSAVRAFGWEAQRGACLIQPPEGPEEGRQHRFPSRQCVFLVTLFSPRVLPSPFAKV